MTNTELNLDQLRTIAAGIVHPAFKTSYQTLFGAVRSKEGFGGFEPRGVKSVEIGDPAESELLLQLLR